MTAKSRAIPVLLTAAATQFAAGIGFWSFGLLAPELAVETGLNERDFGLSITFTFLGTLLSSPFTGAYIRRFGGPGAMVRFISIMIGAVLLVLSGTWTGAMLAAFCFGLGYGPQGPMGMTLVTQNTDPSQRGLFLALRHSTVPLAAGIAGRALPPFMIWVGWQAGILSVAGVLALALLLSLLTRPWLQIEAAPARPGGALARFKGIFEIPENLRFLWSIGMVFALTQTAVTMFSYIYLLEVVGLSAIAAGIFASNLHLTALFGRPALGWLTDRIGNAQMVLAGIAMTSVIAMVWLLQVGEDTAAWVLIPIAIACGVSGQCWNSVFVTAMSFRIETEDLADLNGRAFAFLSIGWLMSPPIIWSLIELTGGYTIPLAGIAVMNAVVTCVLLLIRGR
ncbi:MAG: MFS transporter [Pseudomonadota bacterium]